MALSKQKLTVNIEDIKNNLELFKDGIELKVADQIVAMFGSTKSGKTTIINILDGKTIIKVKQEGSWCIDVLNEDYAVGINSRGFDKFKIFAGGNSGTKYANLITVEGVQLSDLPGLGDNREIETEISNSCYVHTILSSATALGKGGVKIVIVQDANSTSVEGGKSFKDCIKTLCLIFEPNEPADFFKLIRSTMFIFTKVTPSILSDPTLTPEQYLADVIAKLDTNISEAEIERKPYAERATIDFIRTLKYVHSLDPTQIKHVRVPLVCWDSYDMAAFTDPITDPKNGVMAKLRSVRPLKDCRPKLAVSTDAAHFILKIQCTYDAELAKHCEAFNKQMTVMFEKMEKERAALILEEISKYSCVKKSLLDHGGSTKLSKDLIDYLLKLELGEAYTSLLTKMKKTVEHIESFDLLLRNGRAGANFLTIYTAVWTAAKHYVTEEERKVRILYENDLRAYMEQQNNITSVLSALTFPIKYLAMAFSSGTAHGEGIEKVMDGFVKAAAASIGDLEKPCESMVKKFAELKHSIDASKF